MKSDKPMHVYIAIDARSEKLCPTAETFNAAARMFLFHPEGVQVQKLTYSDPESKA